MRAGCLEAHYYAYHFCTKCFGCLSVSFAITPFCYSFSEPMSTPGYYYFICASSDFLASWLRCSALGPRPPNMHLIHKSGVQNAKGGILSWVGNSVSWVIGFHQRLAPLIPWLELSASFMFDLLSLFDGQNSTVVPSTLICILNFCNNSGVMPVYEGRNVQFWALRRMAGSEAGGIKRQGVMQSLI